jgi:hypothetical protein
MRDIKVFKTGTSEGFAGADRHWLANTHMSTWAVDGKCSCGKVLTRNRTMVLDGVSMCHACNVKAFERKAHKL